MKTSFLLLFFALGAAKASDQGLVVLDFQSKGILDKTVLRDLWERTWELAFEVPEAQTVSADQTRRELFEQNILVPLRCDEFCYRRLAQRLHAGRLLVPTVEKNADQLKFSFVLVQGSTGKTIRSTSLWSDGRVDRALGAGVSKVLDAGGSPGSPWLSSAAWKATGFAIAGLGAALWLGLEQPRSSPTPTTASGSSTSGTSINPAGF